MFEVTAQPEQKQALYPLLNKQAHALMAGETDALANLSNIASLLNITMPDLNWVGFYIRRGEKLVLGPFQGNPACVQIPMGRGVCGTAAAEQTTQRVDDVCAFPGHIACDAASRSELVVPILVNNEVVAVLDIDSPIEARFDSDDQIGIEQLALKLAEAIDFQQLTY